MYFVMHQVQDHWIFEHISGIDAFVHHVFNIHITRVYRESCTKQGSRTKKTTTFMK